MTNSDFSPATLEDVPGARLFGAQYVSEGYVVLQGERGPHISDSPSEFLLLFLRRKQAARLLAGCLVFLSVLFVCIISYCEITMGQSMTTPLSLTLDHWAEVHDRASNQSVEIEKKKWQILCTSEWPTFNMGWPRDGTFNITTILQIKERVCDKGPHGHPDQVAYIVTWESLACNPPPWESPMSFPNYHL